MLARSGSPEQPLSASVTENEAPDFMSFVKTYKLRRVHDGREVRRFIFGNCHGENERKQFLATVSCCGKSICVMI